MNTAQIIDPLPKDPETMIVLKADSVVALEPFAEVLYEICVRRIQWETSLEEHQAQLRAEIEAGHLLYHRKDMEILLTGRMYNDLLAEITVQGTGGKLWYVVPDQLIERRRRRPII